MDWNGKVGNLWPFETSDECPSIDILKVNLNKINLSWQLLTEISKMLRRTVTLRSISPKARISPTVVLEGPIVVEPGVTIYDYAKIVGPAFISRGAIIGNHSLVRESFLGEGCVVGYLVDIARSILGNSCWLSQSHIADSILGNNVNLGGGTILTSLRLDNRPIQISYGKKIVNTNLLKFGALVGSKTQIGANVITMPGVIIGCDCIICPDVLVDHNLEDNTFCKIKQSIVIRRNTESYSSETHFKFKKDLMKDED